MRFFYTTMLLVVTLLLAHALSLSAAQAGLIDRSSDSDMDGCTAAEELGSDPMLGGLRGSLLSAEPFEAGVGDFWQDCFAFYGDDGVVKDYVWSVAEDPEPRHEPYRIAWYDIPNNIVSVGETYASARFEINVGVLGISVTLDSVTDSLYLEFGHDYCFGSLTPG